VELDADEETDSPDMSYDWEMDDREEFFTNVESGKWLWFSAAVRVHHKPSDCCLGSSHLGGCCYESLEDFAKNGGYLRDMVSEAIAETRTCLETFKHTNS